MKKKLTVSEIINHRVDAKRTSYKLTDGGGQYLLIDIADYHCVSVKWKDSKAALSRLSLLHGFWVKSLLRFPVCATLLLIMFCAVRMIKHLLSEFDYNWCNPVWG